jgi:hypothetical protein
MTADFVGDSEPLVVQRWRRYGHDRAYVKRGEADLGYRDLKTGAVVCPSPHDVELVTGATTSMWERARKTAYVPRHGSSDDVGASPADMPSPDSDETVPAKSVASNETTVRGPALMPDRDLALNRPGQAAREQALELRAAAPVRTIVARLTGAKTDERAYRIGADGEEEVARQLARLGPQWHVLHAVPVGDRNSDIDHVAIGPSGVFTINTKNHPQANVWVCGDTFKVNGSNQHYIRNSRHEAQRAARLLSAAAGFDVEVRGVIAVMGAHRGFIVKEQPRDGVVRVVTRREVVKNLSHLQPVLGGPSIARIFDVARHLSTWQPTRVRRDEFPISL